MNISLNPWYYCNFRCDFCYLTEKQLSSSKLLSIDLMKQRLDEVVERYNKIDHIDVYGGEIGILPKEYFNEMTSLLKNYTTDLNINTNLSMLNDITLDENYTLSVSYDFQAREKHDQVFKNMGLLDRKFSVLMLASKKLLEQDPDEQIMLFNLLPNCQSVEIKPYSTNQANQQRVTDKDFEEFIKRWLMSPIPKNFMFTNEVLLERVLDKESNSFSDDHVYITPSGNFAVLEFDLNDNEYFLELKDLDEYAKWCNKEKKRVYANKYCGSCEYLGKCLSEHLRNVKSLDNSCNGFKHLIQWYEKLQN